MSHVHGKQTKYYTQQQIGCKMEEIPARSHGITFPNETGEGCKATAEPDGAEKAQLIAEQMSPFEQAIQQSYRKTADYVHSQRTPGESGRGMLLNQPRQKEPEDTPSKT